ncbi:MAG: hypothetical protein AMXMBFR23_00600 [Chloroflexota bacterium]
MAAGVSTEAPGVRRVLLLASVMALGAGSAYLTIGLGFVADGFQSPPRPVMLTAAVIYLAGSLALHRVSPRLLLLGALANGGVLALFLLSAATDRATVDALSVGGKAAQALLSLLLLLAWRSAGTRPR